MHSMAGIFVSYRREDSSGHAGRLTQALRDQFPDTRVFFDLQAIKAGVDFVASLQTALSSSSVLLAVIGPRWLSAQDASGKRRLDDESDFVRLEITTALQRGVNVIPVLVGDAKMPTAADLPEQMRPLATLNALRLSDQSWDYEEDKLFQRLVEIPEVGPRRDISTRGLLRAAADVSSRVTYGAGLLFYAGIRVIAIWVLAYAASFIVGPYWPGDPGTWVSISKGTPIVLIVYTVAELAVVALRRWRKGGPT